LLTGFDLALAFSDLEHLVSASDMETLLTIRLALPWAAVFDEYDVLVRVKSGSSIWFQRKV
jgi:hypothetical protein